MTSPLVYTSLSASTFGWCHPCRLCDLDNLWPWPWWFKAGVWCFTNTPQTDVRYILGILLWFVCFVFNFVKFNRNVIQVCVKYCCIFVVILWNEIWIMEEIYLSNCGWILYLHWAFTFSHSTKPRGWSTASGRGIYSVTRYLESQAYYVKSIINRLIKKFWVQVQTSHMVFLPSVCYLVGKWDINW